jgi:hypothetical protein
MYFKRISAYMSRVLKKILYHFYKSNVIVYFLNYKILENKYSGAEFHLIGTVNNECISKLCVFLYSYIHIIFQANKITEYTYLFIIVFVIQI